MNRYVFALFACALSAVAQTNTLNVTATQLSQQTTRSMFGPLAKQYLAATVTVCNSGASSVSVPLAAVLQVPGAVPAGVTVLPPLAALTVIAAAQGSTKRAKIERGAIAAVSVAAVSTGFTGISQQAKTILTNVALNGPALVSIFDVASTPNSLVNYAQATLPDPIQLVAGGCAPPAVVLVEIDQKAVKANFKVSR